jgi:hypothetical protein
MGKLLNTAATALYVTETYKKPTKESSLNSLRTLGGGPPFYKSGKNIMYDTDDVDEWATSTPMTKCRSTQNIQTHFVSSVRSQMTMILVRLLMVRVRTSLLTRTKTIGANDGSWLATNKREAS